MTSSAHAKFQKGGHSCHPKKTNQAFCLSPDRDERANQSTEQSNKNVQQQASSLVNVAGWPVGCRGANCGQSAKQLEYRTVVGHWKRAVKRRINSDRGETVRCVSFVHRYGPTLYTGPSGKISAQQHTGPATVPNTQRMECGRRNPKPKGSRSSQRVQLGIGFRHLWNLAQAHCGLHKGD